MSLEVIGAGFGRTGTLSLQKALDVLGFGPAYHMQDVFRNRAHVRHWLDYAQAGTADWDSLFSDYRAVVDFPACCAWEELSEKYPEAKVVLTVRDPAAWWKSTLEVIYPTRTMFPGWLKKLVPFTQGWLDMTDALVWSGTFDGRFEDRSYAVGVFEEHTKTVQARCEPGRLLVFEVADGWQPLCDFLGVPVPDGPFPHLNDSASLRRRFAIIRWGSRIAPFAATATIGSALWRRRALAN